MLQDAVAVLAVALVADVKEAGLEAGGAVHVEDELVELALRGDDLREAEVLGRGADVDVGGLAFDVLALAHATHSGVVQGAAETAGHVDGFAVLLTGRIEHVVHQGFEVGLHAIGEAVCRAAEAALRAAVLLALAVALDQFGFFEVFHSCMFLGVTPVYTPKVFRISGIKNEAPAFFMGGGYAF